MAKKVAKKKVTKVAKVAKTSKSRYESFKLHGHYSVQQVAILTVIDLIIGFVLGYLLQPGLADLITSYAAHV